MSQGLALLSLLLGTFAASGAAVAHLRLSHLLPRVLRHASQSWIGVALLLATLVLGGLLTHGLAEQNLWLMVFLALAATSGIVFSLPLAEREAPLAAAWLGVLTGSGMALLGLALGLAPLLASGVLAAMLTLSLSVALGRRVNLPLSRLLWGAKRDAEKSADSESLMPEAMSMDELAARLQQNHEILLIPGFGCMAAEACGALVQLAQTLSDAGHKVYLLAHPLAGRLPGQLALLLREAGATGEQLLEHWPEDKPIPPLTLSIGAHDLIHPQRAGLGVPDLRLQNLDTEARVVLILSQVQGFSGSSNPLFADKHVRLLQADARAALTELHARLISSSDKQNAGA